MARSPGRGASRLTRHRTGSFAGSHRGPPLSCTGRARSGRSPGMSHRLITTSGSVTASTTGHTWNGSV
ncbi:hypothetical protein SGRIM128S_06981 [Streptomyces griseomycini]